MFTKLFFNKDIQHIQMTKIGQDDDNNYWNLLVVKKPKLRTIILEFKIDENSEVKIKEI